MKRNTYAMSKVPLRECQYCDSTFGLQRHHIVPRSLTQQGSDDPENLIVLCRTCHDAAHAKTIDLGRVLTRSQAAKAVLLLGTLSRAHRFLYPTEYPSKAVRAA